MATLFYVVGASGSGKDSLMRAVRARSSKTTPVRLLFAARHITRPRDVSEDHVPASREEFTAMREADLFLLHWESHGLAYGISREVERWLAAGFDVAVNGSREYLEEALTRAPTLAPVLVRADPDVLRTRLTARGRETVADVEARLARAARLDAELLAARPDILVVDNSGPLDAAVAAMERALLRGGC